MKYTGNEICSKYSETHSEIGFYTAGHVERGTGKWLEHVTEAGCQFYILCWLFMTTQTDSKQQG